MCLLTSETKHQLVRLMAPGICGTIPAHIPPTACGGPMPIPTTPRRCAAANLESEHTWVQKTFRSVTVGLPLRCYVLRFNELGPTQQPMKKKLSSQVLNPKDSSRVRTPSLLVSSAENAEFSAAEAMGLVRWGALSRAPQKPAFGAKRRRLGLVGGRAHRFLSKSPDGTPTSRT